MKRFLTVLLSALAVVMLTAAPVKKSPGRSYRIAVAGEPNASIVLDDNADRVVWHAARELQNYFRLLTGTRIHIRNTAPGYKTPYIILGTPESAAVKPALRGKGAQLVKKIKDDGYAVLSRGNRVYIIGAIPRGVLHGVHRFIFKHTDFIWVRPHKELANFTFSPDLTLKVKDYVDNPTFRLRSWLTNARISQYSEEFFHYSVRNGINYLPGSDEPALHSRYMDSGMFAEFGGGHNMSSRWLPRKIYGKTNPEFYMEVNGKRLTTGRLQLCYTNEEMHKVFIANTLKIVNSLPDFYGCINIMIDDTNSYCECKECIKPIKLPDGRVLERSHEAFKSTQFFIFLNKVAREVAKVRPKLMIKSFGYFFTAIPPEIPVEKNIRISYCPYVRNDKETLHGASNAKWLARTIKYTAMSPNIIWREYYFSGAGFPRAQANIIAQDLRFISSRGVKEVTSEHGWGDRPGMRKKHPLPELEYFSITGPEFWTITQLFWNPHQDPDALRNEYIKRVYREGAPGVMKFYKLLRDSWLNDPTASAYNDDYRRSVGRYVVAKKLVEPCRQALAEAAKTVKNPVSSRHLKWLTATFESWLKRAAATAVAEQPVPKIETNEFPNFDFNAGVWKKASTLPPMCVMRRPGVKAGEDTLVKLFHNGRELYIAFQCRFPNGKTVATAGSSLKVWPKGDHVELFFARRAGGYYHLVFNTYANSTSGRYDAYCTDGSWNGNWDVRTQLKNGEWFAVAKIPLKTIDFIPEQNNRLSALIYRVRVRRFPGDSIMHAAWGGGRVHSADSFSDLVFALE